MALSRTAPICFLFLFALLTPFSGILQISLLTYALLTFSNLAVSLLTMKPSPWRVALPGAVLIVMAMSVEADTEVAITSQTTSSDTFEAGVESELDELLAMNTGAAARLSGSPVLHHAARRAKTAP